MGSILSPTVFLLVMNPLLSYLDIMEMCYVCVNLTVEVAAC